MLRSGESDTSSVPGSLFGNLENPMASVPAAMTTSGQQISDQPPPRSSTSESSSSMLDDSRSSREYHDLYARLGSNSSALLDSSVTTSLLGGGGGGGSGNHTDSYSNPLSETWFRVHRAGVRTLAFLALTVLFVLAVFWMAGVGKEVDPPRWLIPNVYQVSFSLRLASGLEEPGVAMVDQTAGAMRVQYYSGMTTFILNKTGPSYSIVPRVAHLACLVDVPQPVLQGVFPDLKLFTYEGEIVLTAPQRGSPSRLVGKKDKEASLIKITCDKWVYKAVPKKQDRRPGASDYIGTYVMYTTSGPNPVPVHFSFVGHNILFGKSHYDNYTIDYFDYNPLPRVDPFWLQPPRGMPCSPIDSDPNGPTMESASQHAQHLSSLFPSPTTVETMMTTYQTQHVDKGRDDFPGKEDDMFRAAVFHESKRMVTVHNRDMSKSYRLALNRFADWTLEERRARLKNSALTAPDKPPSTCKVVPLNELLDLVAATPLPRTVDHRQMGWVLPPGEQGSCGSCWAFAATGAIEGQIAKVTGKPPIPLSEQNLMDCSWGTYGNGACRGGLDYMAFAWAIDHNAGYLATEASYPYLNQDGFCHFDVERKLIADGAHAPHGVPRIMSCSHVTGQYAKSKADAEATNVHDLMTGFNERLHSIGPLSVSIDASPPDFYFFFPEDGGVYDNPACGTSPDQLDHSVLAIGYDLDHDPPYTLVRNNWGLDWGEDGYARISQKGNTCGVGTAAVYVTMEVTSSPTTAKPSSHPASTHSPSMRPVFAPSNHPTRQPVTANPTPEPPTVPPTDPPTPPPTDPPTNPPTNPPTDPPTSPPTDPPTNPPTDPPTPPPTDPPTNPPTPPPTDPPTPPPTDPPTNPPTPPPTDPPTPPPTDPPTNPPTPPPTDPPTNPPTPPPTDPPTPPPTDPPTNPPTPPPTNPPTDPPTNPPTPPPTNPPTDPPTNPPTPPPTDPPTPPPASTLRGYVRRVR